MKNELSICPFCGSNCLEISRKTKGAEVYHYAVFCRKCHTYGPRLLVKENAWPSVEVEGKRYWVNDVEVSKQELYNMLVSNWNARDMATDEIPLLPKEVAILKHTLGLDTGNCVVRNIIVASTNPSNNERALCESLTNKGLMQCSYAKDFCSIPFRVTDKGKEVLKEFIGDFEEKEVNHETNSL